jgi:hypothetical protein
MKVLGDDARVPCHPLAVTNPVMSAEKTQYQSTPSLASVEAEDVCRLFGVCGYRNRACDDVEQDVPELLRPGPL